MVFHKLLRMYGYRKEKRGRRQCILAHPHNDTPCCCGHACCAIPAVWTTIEAGAVPEAMLREGPCGAGENALAALPSSWGDLVNRGWDLLGEFHQVYRHLDRNNREQFCLDFFYKLADIEDEEERDATEKYCEWLEAHPQVDYYSFHTSGRDTPLRKQAEQHTS